MQGPRMATMSRGFESKLETIISNDCFKMLFSVPFLPEWRSPMAWVLRSASQMAPQSAT